MNIKRRLEKLETDSGSNARYCRCKARSEGCAEVFIVSDEPEFQIDTELEEARKTQICEDCGKEINKIVILIQGVSSDIPNPNEISV